MGEFKFNKRKFPIVKIYNKAGIEIREFKIDDIIIPLGGGVVRDLLASTLAWSPDSSKIAVGLSEGQIRIYQAR